VKSIKECMRGSVLLVLKKHRLLFMSLIGFCEPFFERDLRRCFYYALPPSSIRDYGGQVCNHVKR